MKTLFTTLLTTLIYLSALANCTKGDCENGYGFFEGEVTMINVNGESGTHMVKYNGFFNNGEFHDFGRLEYSSGGVFIGQFANGEKNGQGLYTEGGLNMISNYKQGIKHGQSFAFLGEALIEAGVFENGSQIEDLSQDFISGNTKGNCQGDCKNGFGSTYYSKMQLTSVGFHKKGKAHGLLFTSRAGGDVYIGNDKNAKGPQFAIEMKNGLTYIGWMEKGAYHGKGLLSFDNGSQQAGEFKKGKFKG